MWHNNTHVSSVCTVSMHIFSLTISNVFKNVRQTYVILCTLWMHYLSWNSSVLKQWRIISESSEPQRVRVEFPLFSPGSTTEWDYVRNSHWEEVQSVGQDPILWQWYPSLLPSLGTFACKRDDAVRQDHAEGHISNFTWLCLASGMKTCLVWKTWSPWFTLLRGCSRETCMKTTWWFIITLPASVQDGVQHQRDSLSPRTVKTPETSEFKSSWKWPIVPSIVFYGWRLQWRLMRNSETSSCCLSVRM